MKLPFFHFYPGDFIYDTEDLTDEEVGIYIRLLCRLWRRGSVSRVDGVPQIIIERYLVQDDDGSYYNERLRDMRKDLEMRQQKLSHAARNAAAMRWQCDTHAGGNATAMQSQCDSNATQSQSQNHSQNKNKNIPPLPPQGDYGPVIQEMYSARGNKKVTPHERGQILLMVGEYGEEKVLAGIRFAADKGWHVTVQQIRDFCTGKIKITKTAEEIIAEMGDE